jgi:hypothetical protein
MNGSVRAPVHLWIVGLVGALWNGFGCLDYVMTQTRNAAWMTQMTEQQRAWIDAAPFWSHGAWALGVWGGLVGCLLLLARSRHAVAAFIVSLVGLAVNTFYQFTAPMPSGHMDTGGALALHAVIWSVAIGLLVYAMRMRSRGLLR